MRKTLHISWETVTILLCGALGGCAGGGYEAGTQYEPQPALVEVLHRTGAAPQQVPLTVLASVKGVRQGDARTGTPRAVELRLRFENHGPSHVEFDPGSLELTTGVLRDFPPPRATPPAPIELSPGQSQTVTALFPLPVGLDARSPELDHLRLRWRVNVNGQSVPQTVLFVRDSGTRGMSNDPLAG